MQSAIHSPSIVRCLWRCAAIAILGIALAPAADAALHAREDFNYPSGGDLTGYGGGESFGFSDSWTGQVSYNVSAGSLASPRNPLPMVGNSVTAVAFAENRGIDRHLSAPLGTEGTTIYVSLLIQPQGTLHQGAYDGWFALALRGTTSVFIGMNYSKSQYGLRIADAYSTSSVGAVVGNTAFLVLRMDFTDGIDPAYLYVNPQPGAPEPATPSASLTSLDYDSLIQMSLTGPGAVGFDAIRIGTSYADVAPATSDFDGDMNVDRDDLERWTAGFGMTGTAASANGDADADGDVDGRDFLIWQSQYGYQFPTAGGQPIPEPGAIHSLASSAIALAAACRCASKSSMN